MIVALRRYLPHLHTALHLHSTCTLTRAMHSDRSVDGARPDQHRGPCVRPRRACLSVSPVCLVVFFRVWISASPKLTICRGEHGRILRPGGYKKQTAACGTAVAANSTTRFVCKQQR